VKRRENNILCAVNDGGRRRLEEHKTEDGKDIGGRKGEKEGGERKEGGKVPLSENLRRTTNSEKKNCMAGSRIFLFTWGRWYERQLIDDLETGNDTIRKVRRARGG
jgi:hypothetical protein